MSEEVELTPKVNCGVWTAIENYINRENNEKIWDTKNVLPKATVSRKKERIRARKCVTPTINLVTQLRHSASNCKPGSDASSGQSGNNLANSFAHRALIVRKTRNEYAEEVFERSKRMLETCNIPVIECSFNLPRVNAQLERLMGSNVVHLTDRKYMTELRRRISEDFESMLMKRIHQRKQEEIGRQMKLVLCGLYSARNVPKNLITAHSVVLAEEVHRQRVLLMEGKLPKCPKELRNHPVLKMNESTNNFIIKRRAKLKTERERVSERMIRLSKKWEADNLVWEEKQQKKQEEMKTKEMELLACDQSYAKKLEVAGGCGPLDKSFRRNEMNMVDFLAKERKLMLHRLKPKEKKFVPFTKDLREVDAKRRMSEASIQKLKSIVLAKRSIRQRAAGPANNDDEGEDALQDAQSYVVSDVDTISTSSKSKKQGFFGMLLSKLTDGKSKSKNDLRSELSESSDAPETSKSSREKKKSAIKKTRKTPASSAKHSTPPSVAESPDSSRSHSRLETPRQAGGSKRHSKDIYIDPVIVELKNAKNVKELYDVAEKIVGLNIENLLNQSKSDAEEPST